METASISPTTGPSRRSPTTTRPRTTRSTTRWTSSSSRRSPSCVTDRRPGDIWRGEGKCSRRSRRQLDRKPQGRAHAHELMRRGHRGIQQIWEIDAPIIVAHKGWTMVRLVPAGTPVRHPRRGPRAPGSGCPSSRTASSRNRGFGTLFQDRGARAGERHGPHRARRHGEEALHHGIVSRLVPPDDLDSTVRRWRKQIASAPAASVRMARSIIRHHRVAGTAVVDGRGDDRPDVLSRTDDMSELRAARADDSPPNYTGS